ncbi:hypothetical protein [Williamsia soli]|uniref:hypothetical protein n=1 Tax=Williamsia soli TaxID=364929 RepID=UPI001A9F28EA|nr:hypothetical protein [Williamsia soli]
MTTPTSTTSLTETETTTSRGRWPWVGVAAGIGALAATLAFDLHPEWDENTPYTADIVDDISSGKAHGSIITGYLTVALLLVLAASWKRHVEPRTPSSTAARVVPLGFTASAGALSLGYGWKGAMGLYNGGNEDETFDKAGLYVLYVLNDFGSFIGYLGVTVAAGAIAWMAFGERLVSRWIGVVSVLAVLPVIVTVAAFGLPGFPGVVSGVWLVVVFAGLALGKSTINR